MIYFTFKIFYWAIVALHCRLVSGVKQAVQLYVSIYVHMFIAICVFLLFF